MTRYPWEQQTVVEAAQEKILALLQKAPMPSRKLREKVMGLGFSKWAFEKGQRELFNAGEIRIYRKGSNTSGWTVELIK